MNIGSYSASKSAAWDLIVRRIPLFSLVILA